MGKNYSLDEVLAAIAVEGADGTEGCCAVDIEERGYCCMLPGLLGKLKLAESMGWCLVPMRATEEMNAALGAKMFSADHKPLRDFTKAPMTYVEAYEHMVAARPTRPSTPTLNEDKP